jgi:DNA-directed RNA polymerase specialized sigma24 family protein
MRSPSDHDTPAGPAARRAGPPDRADAPGPDAPPDALPDALPDARLDDVFPAVYDELRRVAHRHLRGEQVGHTLGTTALVHEAYLELAKLEQVRWSGQAYVAATRGEELLALDEALDRLAAVSARQARVVECRFFGGMSVEETAEALGSSPATVKRDWTVARAWLNRELAG